MTLISPLDSIWRKVTGEIILSVSGEISLRDGTNPTFLHLEIHTTTSQTIYIFINLHIFHSIRTCEGEGGSKDPFNQKILNACNFFAQFARYFWMYTWNIFGCTHGKGFLKKYEKTRYLNKGFSSQLCVSMSQKLSIVFAGDKTLIWTRVWDMRAHGEFKICVVLISNFQTLNFWNNITFGQWQCGKNII